MLPNANLRQKSNAHLPASWGTSPRISYLSFALPQWSHLCCTALHSNNNKTKLYKVEPQIKQQSNFQILSKHDYWPYKPGTDLTASSLQWQVIQTNTNGLFFFLLFLVISGNKTDSAKLLIIVLESSGEIGLHRPLAHDIPCHAIYRQCLGNMYKST